MAQKTISDVEAAAFLVATANTKQDFEDCKEFFKLGLQRQLSKTDNKLEVYQDAVKGFLMELQAKDMKQVISTSNNREGFKVIMGRLRSEIDHYETVLKFIMPLWLTLSFLGGAGLIIALVKLIGI